MKRFFAILISMIMIVTCTTACTKHDADNLSENNLNIVTSFYPMYVFVKNITDGVDEVNVKNMTEVNTGCLHDYQLLPEDMKTLETADIFIINGAGMESFMDDCIKRLPNLNVVEASRDTDLLLANNDHHDVSEDENHHNHDEHEYNSHVWLSPKNAIIEVENITKALMEVDPVNADKYKNNSEIYIDTLKNVDLELSDMLKPFEGKNIITTHEAFDYMAKEYNFNISATIQTGHNQAISASQMAELLNMTHNDNIAAIVAEEQYESTVINSLANESGVKVAELNAFVSGNDDYKNVYRTTMIDNAKALLAVLD